MENPDDDIEPRIVRCILSGETFDFNQDLGAVEIGRGAACTPCQDRLFTVSTALYPNGSRMPARKKPVLVRTQ